MKAIIDPKQFLSKHSRVSLKELDQSASIYVFNFHDMIRFATEYNAQFENQAIAFKEWCDNGHQFDNDFLYQKTHTTSELFEIFKTQL